MKGNVIAVINDNNVPVNTNKLPLSTAPITKLPRISTAAEETTNIEKFFIPRIAPLANLLNNQKGNTIAVINDNNVPVNINKSPTFIAPITKPPRISTAAEATTNIVKSFIPSIASLPFLAKLLNGIVNAHTKLNNVTPNNIKLPVSIIFIAKPPRISTAAEATISKVKSSIILNEFVISFPRSLIALVNRNINAPRVMPKDIKFLTSINVIANAPTISTAALIIISFANAFIICVAALTFSTSISLNFPIISLILSTELSNDFKPSFAAGPTLLIIAIDLNISHNAHISADLFLILSTLSLDTESVIRFVIILIWLITSRAPSKSPSLISNFFKLFTYNNELDKDLIISNNTFILSNDSLFIVLSETPIEPNSEKFKINSSIVLSLFSSSCSIELVKINSLLIVFNNVIIWTFFLINSFNPSSLKFSFVELIKLIILFTAVITL